MSTPCRREGSPRLHLTFDLFSRRTLLVGGGGKGEGGGVHAAGGVLHVA
jgi:hypothetical protein